MVPASSPPYQQFQSFYPPVDNAELLAHLASQTQHINQNIYQSTDKLTAGINSTSQYLTGGLNNLGKEVTQSSLGLRDAIERGNQLSGSAIERTTGEIKLNTAIQDAASRQAAADSARDILRAVDANGSMNNSTIERVGLTVGNAVERNASINGAAIERTAGNIATAIEKVAGEGRLTTTVTDAASRQAAADSARDITRAVENNGSAITSAVERNGAHNHSATQAMGSTLLSTIERVAGEGRVTTTVTDAASRQAAADSARDILGAVERNGGNNGNLVQSTAAALGSAIERNGGDTRTSILTASNLTNSLLTDVRHAIINDVNRGTEELLASGTQNFNVVSKAVTDSAWETRNAMNSNMLEQLKSFNNIQQQSAQNYASTLLEGQKSTALLSLDGNNHYASLMLEQQKLKEYLSSKGDSHFAMNQLEMHKVKEGLAAQAAHNFAALQLDQHKNKEAIQAQLADAKYDALKNTQFLADKLCECCCEVKQKIDLVDRDRLRDNLLHSRDENSLLRVAEFLDRRDDRRGHRHWDDRDRRGDDRDRRGDDRR